jgi:hypothetical protein
VQRRPTEEETLRLVVAFYCIMETENRDCLIELAEMFAKQSQAAEGNSSALNRDQPAAPEGREPGCFPSADQDD